MAARTLFEKVWDAHVVYQEPGQPALLYVDLHLVHEVSPPLAFEGLRLAGRKVRRPNLTFAVTDHITPTGPRDQPITDELAIKMVNTLERNCADFGIHLEGYLSPRQGIVHVIGPELGLVQPGMVIVCGDSHTVTPGGMGSISFGIGTTELEHVFATQTILQVKPKTMEVRVDGALPFGVAPKDVILGIIREIGVSSSVGHAIEFTGSTIREMSVEGRLTLSNMSVEAGARVGMIAPDDVTFRYLEGRPYAPKGAEWERALDYWRSLPTDPGAKYDRSVALDAKQLEPFVTWGTNPSMVAPIGGRVPDPSEFRNEEDRVAAERAVNYMGLKPGTPMMDIPIDHAFIGSCSASRIEDLRAAAAVARGHKVDPRVRAMIMPGSMQVKAQAEKEGLDAIFKAAGFEWRTAGCSLCTAINDDVLPPGARCASTGTRNFEGRQGPGRRTHLLSPAMVAAAAIRGHFADIRNWDFQEAPTTDKSWR